LSARDTGAGALLGVVGGVWATLVTYAGLALGGLPFPPFELFDWEARALPGAVVNLTVAAIVKVVTAVGVGPTDAVAKVVEHGFAIVEFLLLGTLLGIVLALWSRRRPTVAPAGGVLLGTGVWLAFAAMEWRLGATVPSLRDLAWLALVFVGWGAVTGLWLRGASSVGAAGVQEAGRAGTSRRDLLYWTGLAGVAAGAGVLASLVLRRTPAGETPAAGTPVSAPGEPISMPTSGPAASPPEATLAARIPPAPGTRAEVTPTADFYRIDIDSLPPPLDASTWRLHLGGAVASPRSLTLKELRGLPSITQAVTLSCISNPVGGSLISSGFFTGVPLRRLVSLVRPDAGVTALNIRSADGFYESMALATAMDERTLLVYALNGEPLPAAHGFPARVYIPDRYGMKQPKWVTSIELAVQGITGYWVERGWDREAHVRTTSVIDAPRDEVRPRDGNVTVGGIAYSGAKGIGKVEVQVDGGSWQKAELRVPPLSPLTWVQWRIDLPLAPGSHTLSVRAWDGEGRPQATAPSDSYPAGATGIFSRRIQVGPGRNARDARRET
jgi:DMSO/TMAO reductase YedYZ molybdopterin-dependent catalytic subunit